VGQMSLRLRVMIGIAIVLAIVVAWRYGPGQGDNYGDMGPDEARIRKLERDGDTEGLGAEIANGDLRVARMALAALGRMATEAAVEQIVAATSDGRPHVRAAAAFTYASALSRPEAPLLTDLLLDKDEDPAVRATAASAIGRMLAYEEMESLLTAMVHDTELSVRSCAAQAVWTILYRKDERYRAGASKKERHTVVYVDTGDQVGLATMWNNDKEQVGQFHDSRRNKSE